MELNWLTIGSLIFVAWGIQAFLTIIQMQNYRKHINALIHDGEGVYLGIGSSSGRIRAGVVIALLTDELGKVIKAERMKGRTVFARFMPLDSVLGHNIDEFYEDGDLLDEFDQNTKKSIQMASDLVKKKMASAQSSLSSGDDDVPQNGERNIYEKETMTTQSDNNDKEPGE